MALSFPMDMIAELPFNPAWFAIVVFPFFFAGMLFLVGFILSRLGGWGRLGKRFPAPRFPEGKVLRGQSAQLSGFCNYNRCLTMVIAKEGLYMEVFPLFRFAHPSLLIPWEEMKNEKHGYSLWMKKVTFEVGSPRVAKIAVLKKLFDQFPGRGQA